MATNQAHRLTLTNITPIRARVSRVAATSKDGNEIFTICEIDFGDRGYQQIKLKLKQQPGMEELDTSEVVFNDCLTIVIPEEVMAIDSDGKQALASKAAADTKQGSKYIRGSMDFIVILTTEIADGNIKALSCIVRDVAWNNELLIFTTDSRLHRPYDPYGRKVRE